MSVCALPLLVLLASAQPSTSASPSASPCATPRQAAATFLGSLRDDVLDARRAARCAESPKDLSRVEKERLVTVLKETLDASGARVRLEELPDSADHLDARSYEPVVVLSSVVPRLRFERSENGEWLIPAAVVREADQIHDDVVAFDLQRFARSLPPWMRAKLLGVAAWQGLALLLLLLFGWLVGGALVRVLAWKLAALVARVSPHLNKDDLRAAAWPVAAFVASIIVWLGMPSLVLPLRFASVAVQLARLSAALSLIALLYTVVDAGARHFAAKAKESSARMDDHVVPLVRRVLKIVVVLVGFIVILQSLSIDVGSLVAGLGIGGLAVALAAKDTIGNFFGSVALFLDRPFQVGDWVQTPEVEGTLEGVGFRSTQVRTIKDTVVSVPNAKMADSVIENYGARKARHVRAIVNLTYATSPTQIEAFCDGVRALLIAHPHVDKERIEVHLHALGAHSLDVLVQFYLVRPSWGAELRARHEVLLDIVRLTHDLGIAFAFPTQTLHVAGAPSAEPEHTQAELLSVIQSYAPGGKNVVPPGPRILPRPPTEPPPAPERAGDAHRRGP